MKKSFFVLACSLFLVFGCTVTEVSTLKGNTNGSSLTDIHVEDYFIDVLTDFAEFMPEKDESIMDNAISSFSGQLAASSSATAVQAVKSSENDYTLYFDYSSFQALASELSGNPNQSIIRQDKGKLSFYVDINNYTELEAVVPFLADPNIEVFLAKYNIGYSEEDYLDMIVFSLGEEAPESLKTSYITIDLKLPGDVLTVNGAVKTAKDSIRYSFRLIDFLLLSSPLKFEVSWKV